MDRNEFIKFINMIGFSNTGLYYKHLDKDIKIYLFEVNSLPTIIKIKSNDNNISGDELKIYNILIDIFIKELRSIKLKKILG